MSLNEVLITTSMILWIILGITVLVAVAVITPRLLRAVRSIEGVSKRLEERASPLFARSDQLLDKSSQIASMLLSNVEAVDDTVARATDSVGRMVDLAEERISDLNALLQVAQEEAEETFFSLAGVLRALRGQGGSRKRRRKLLKKERRRYG